MKPNQFSQVLSPNETDQGVWVHQDAWFHIGEFDQDTDTTYNIRKKGNGVYAFILEGKAEIEGQALSKRDCFGIWDTDQIKVSATANSRILLIEVPMN